VLELSVPCELELNSARQKLRILSKRGDAG
jgi:exonuclease VII small subunit